MSPAIDGSAIDKVLREAVEAGAVPHVAAIAADRDGIIYEGGAGARTVGESGDPVSTSTQFRIMSMTKMVCTTAALQQIERGELEMDAPIDIYCPDIGEHFRNRKHPTAANDLRSGPSTDRRLASNEHVARSDRLSRDPSRSW